MFFCNPIPGEDLECVTSPYIYLGDISRAACGDMEKWVEKVVCFFFFSFFTFKPQRKATRTFIWEDIQKMNSDLQLQVWGEENWSGQSLLSTAVAKWDEGSANILGPFAEGDSTQWVAGTVWLCQLTTPVSWLACSCALTGLMLKCFNCEGWTDRKG